MAYVDIQPALHAAHPSLDWSLLSRRMSYACWLFAGILGLLAAAMAYGQYQKMSTWEATEATLTKSEIYSDLALDNKGHKSVVYGARFTFSYFENGREQVGIADLGYRSGFRSWIQKQADALPVGTHRVIRINPDNPAELSLASDFGQLSFASSYFAFGVSLIVFAIGLALWWWSVQLMQWRDKRLSFAEARH